MEAEGVCCVTGESKTKDALPGHIRRHINLNPGTTRGSPDGSKGGTDSRCVKVIDLRFEPAVVTDLME